ncbi:MAG TPA: ROK family protein [Anaerolineaceae bacterium]|nr:ROK family protein [Anaerolineaceae bacterium]
MDYCLAVDIGGTKIAIALISPDGKLAGEIHSFAIPFDSQGIADPLQMIELIRPFTTRELPSGCDLRGIGLSVCGNIDRYTEEAVLVANLHWRNLHFSRMVKQALNLPVRITKDTRAAVLAEHTWGIAKGISDFAWCTVGTGYGGYLYLNDRLYDGYHGFAGEIGHTTYDDIHGYPCGCGRRGCFETFVTGPAIARAGQSAIDSGRSPIMSELAGGNPVSSYMVFQAKDAGDPAAVEIIDQVIRLISINLGSLVNILDLHMIVMGGGIVNASPDFVPRINSLIRDFLETEEAKRDLLVVKETFPNAALFGSAADFFIYNSFLPAI